MTNPIVPSSHTLVRELRMLIEATRSGGAQTVNSELVALHWQVGKRLREEAPGHERAAYREEIVAQVAPALTAEFSPGFSTRSLCYPARFAEVFPDAGIVHAQRSQLSGTHFPERIAVGAPPRCGVGVRTACSRRRPLRWRSRTWATPTKQPEM